MTAPKSDGDEATVARAELERLKKLRRDVAAGLLEVSKSAKQDAETLLAADEAADGVGAEVQTDETPAVTPDKTWLYGAFGAGLVCGLVIAMLFAPSGGDSTSPDSAGVTASAPQVAAAPTPPEPVDAAPPTTEPEPEPEPEPAAAPAPVPPQPASVPTDGLVLSIRASGPCWISATIDDGESPLERLLSPDDTIVLEATEQAVLRIGDPSAISMSINGQPTRSLGAAGRAVDLRITQQNFRDFLN